MGKEQIQIEQLHKELDLIQSCIKRMASNSFYLKGWFFAVLGLGGSVLNNANNNVLGCFSIMLVVVALWWLDGFFLLQETLYRKKYEWVIENRPKGNWEYIYDLNPYNSDMWLDKDSVKTSVYIYMKSKTLIRLYPMGIVLPLGCLLPKYFLILQEWLSKLLNTV